jgi:chloramphenicol 3-O phosphotransferase
MSATGTIVVLNGPSSAGKTTLARATRARVGVTATAVSIDEFFTFMHPDANNNWRMFSTLNDAVFATAIALASGGFHVIVDTVFERPDAVLTAERALAAHAHHFVAVTCDLRELEAREAKRGDRRIGQAREQHTRVLQNARYALHLDTSLLSVEDCVAKLVSLLEPQFRGS